VQLLPQRLASHSDKTLAFLDGTVVEGKMVSDKMELHVDVIDTRAAPDADKVHGLGNHEGTQAGSTRLMKRVRNTSRNSRSRIQATTQ
jgi:hypothetical protein